jgi:hypothetical protein
MNPAALLFYFGTLISSIGSFTFNICLVAFLVRSGFDLFHVSLILGLQRLVPVLVSGVLGHRTDELSPKLTVVAAELGAAAATIGILWAWSLGHPGYWFLVAFTITKTSIVSFQVGSKAKLTKLLADESYASNSQHAVWFNKATQGATLFAGLCAWPIIKYLGFSAAIWFDLLTFAVNGLLVWSIQFQGEAASIDTLAKPTIFSKFFDFYRYNGRTAVLDLVLAISMMGTTSFTARLAGDNQVWVAILIGSYGAAVWIAGSLERANVLKSQSLIFWAGLGLSYALLGCFPERGLVTLCFALLKDTFYWLLLHRISTHIQMDTPQPVMGAVTSARVTQMVLILASGELMVGAWSKVVPVFYDGLWRSIFCFAVLAALCVPKFRTEEKYGYARL